MESIPREKIPHLKHMSGKFWLWYTFLFCGLWKKE